MHSLVMVGGVLWAPLHRVLGVLSLWVLCQVAGCIRDVVHAAFRHRHLVMPRSNCELQLPSLECIQGGQATELHSRHGGGIMVTMARP